MTASARPVGEGQAARRGTLLALLTLGVLGSFGPLSMDAYLPSLPRVVVQLHTSSWAVQLSLTTSLVGLALGQLVAGPASDRHGRRLVALVGCAGFVIASILCAITPNVGFLILFRLLQGCCGAAGIVVSRASVRDMYSGLDLRRVYSRMMMVTGSLPIIAPVIGAQILRVTGWRGVFWVLAVAGALVLILTAVTLPETLVTARTTDHTLRGDLRIYRQIARDRCFFPYVLAFGLFCGVLFAFISGSSFVIQQVYGHSATVFSFVFAGVSVGQIAVGQYNARLVNTRSPQTLTRLAMGVATVGSVGILLIAILGTGDGMWLFVVALVVAVAPNGVINPNANALALQHYRANAGAAAALIGVATYLVGGLVAPLVGVAGGHTMVPLGLVMATSATLGLVLLVTLERPSGGLRITRRKRGKLA